MVFASITQVLLIFLFACLRQTCEAKPLPFTLNNNRMLALNTDLHSFQIISNDLENFNSNFYNVNLRHRVISYYTTPAEVITMCYYNIHEEDQQIFMDASKNYNIKDETDESIKKVILDIKKDIQHKANTGKRLISANEFDETKRSCVLKTNEVGRMRFAGEVLVADVEYYIDLSGKTFDYPDITNYKKGKMLMSYPLEGYKYECLHGEQYCDLKSEPFTTTFD